MTLKRWLLVLSFIVIAAPLTLVLVTMVYPSFKYRTNGSIMSGSEEREYLLYVPKSYDAAKPTPLVISLHGAMNWPGFQEEITRWNQTADANGFIVVYPAGTGTGPRMWEMAGWRNPAQMPDVRFIAALIDRLQKRYNIDPARIYADGLSNGGGMAFVLSCTLANRIAAIGAVAAAQLLPFNWCKDETPVPMIAFHGDADNIVPYEGGRVWIAPLPFPNVPQWVASWAQRNRCAPKPVEWPAAADVRRTQYTGCADNAVVVLYTVKGGGHTWPGGGAIPGWLAAEMALFGLPIGARTDNIDATRELWKFFRDHPLHRN